MPSTNILVVEDEPIIAMDIKRRLNRLGYEVVAIADSFETALEATRDCHPDLVLMDIRLQGDVDGIATAAQMRSQHELPIIFLTAHADQDTLTQAKQVQPFGYLVKPIENEDLVTAIETALSRHQAEIAMQKALDTEKELHLLKSQFVSVVSHEFRTPLSIILSSLDLLEYHDPIFTPIQKKTYLQQARSAVDLMTHLLDEVLAVGEIETGKLQYRPAPLHLYSFCCGLIEEFHILDGGDPRIIFSESNLAEDADILFHLDERLLRHILSNLLSNALKYSSLASPVRFELHLDSVANTLIFKVQDQGIGIPPGDQAHLFEAFYRGSNVENIPGTGLGLSIVKQCVNLHHGAIAVDSEVGVGTCFTVTIPLSGVVSVQ